MKSAILMILAVMGMVMWDNAEDSYTETSKVDPGVKVGEKCQFRCTMSWKDTVLTELKQGTVSITAPDGSDVEPGRFTTTYSNTAKSFSIDGNFVGSKAGTYTITFEGKDTFGNPKHKTTETTKVLADDDGSQRGWRRHG